MNAPLQGLTERIRQEMVELDQVVTRLSEAWQRARRSGDDFYLDSVALNLHGFYSGIEWILNAWLKHWMAVCPKAKTGTRLYWFK